MRLISFGERYGEKPGVMVGETKALDLDAALPGGQRWTWRRILEEGLFGDVQRLAEAGDGATVDLADVRLAPPVPDPSKVICVGLNYRDHAEEQNREIPEKPMLFPKVPSALVGHSEPVVIPIDEPNVDHEVELAFVMAKRARNVAAADAYDHILGYTVMNDVSGRKAQHSERQWLRAKGFETFGPMGPWIVTKDEIPDPHTLKLECRVNGELRQSSDTSQLIFTVPFLVEFLSRSMTLEPGDVVSTGTPGGVGVFRDPPIFLKAGDVMTLTVEKIGTLENPISAG